MSRDAVWYTDIRKQGNTKPRNKKRNEEIKMKKTTEKPNKTYPVEIYFELGEVACPYHLELTDRQVRMFWEDVAGETIPSDVEICEVIQTEKDWDYIADAAAEHLFNFICNNKKLDALMAEACA